MSPFSNNRFSQKQRRAFTIVEVMVTSTILGFVSVGLAAFMIQTNRGLFWASEKSKVTNDVRNFTSRISLETLGANTGLVYPSFAPDDRDAAEDQLRNGETGDCLVLIHMEAHPDPDDELHYTRIVVYYRQPGADGLGPVHRAEKEFETPREIETNKGPDHFEAFLAKIFPGASKSHPVVLELSRGLADGSLFKNFGNNTFLVNGEIIHGNQAEEVTNTYNLTISPRG